LSDYNYKKFWLVYIATLIALTVLGIEGIAYIYIQNNIKGKTIFGVPFISSSSQILDGIDSEWLKQFYLTTFDRTLGWEPKPNTKKTERNRLDEKVQWSIDKFGARRNPKFRASLSPNIATFGDSFTFGAEVNDDNTWQYYLSILQKHYVANYGVNGYGTDQALLRYKEKLDEGLRPTFAILGIYEENFKRVLNRFRPFYKTYTGLKLGFKPMAYLDQSGNLSFLPSALDKEVWDRSQLIKLIETSRKNDFWASYRPKKEFPFSANILRAVYLKICKSYPPIPTCNSSKEPDWNSLSVKSIMKALIREFVHSSNDHNVQPVILFLSFGKHSPYSSFVAEIREEYHKQDVRIIDSMEANFNPTKVRLKPNAGHLSPYGNEVVANHIIQYFPKNQ
jgi:hypothetical protein